MNQTQVLALLKDNQNDKGIQKWMQRSKQDHTLKSFGIGLTVLRKLAKQIGRDHELALQLWESDIYDAKIISLLIDDPKKITKIQAEKQVEHLYQGHLAHVFSSCDASLAKTPFAASLAMEWISSKDPMRRSCAYGLIYEESKSKKKNAQDDAFFLNLIEHISQTFFEEESSVQLSMGSALMGIGKRNKYLNTAALEVAKTIGPIEFETNGSKCEPFNVVKHLTSDYLLKKFSA